MATILREDLRLGAVDDPAVRVTPVSIEIGDEQLSANFYKPRAVKGVAIPGIVVAGSLTSVKEMMGGNYARALAECGIAALAIDYRDFGQSGGEPRFYDDPARKLEDFRAATAWFAQRKDISAIGVLGVCTSGGNVLYVAAADRNVAAVGAVAGWYAEPSLTPLVYGGEAEVARRHEAGASARAAFDADGTAETILAYHNTDPTASHVGPMDYYMDAGRGGGVQAWRNAFAVMSWEPWLQFDPVSQAEHVRVPALIIHSDGSAFPDQARKVYDLLPGPKSLHWAEGAHFDFYDHADKVAASADVLAAHFIAHLR